MNIILFVLHCVSFVTCTSYYINSSIEYNTTIQLPVLTGNYDLEFIFNFIRYLNNTHNFHTFITFSNNRKNNTANYIIVRTLQQALMEEFKMPVVVWGRNNVAQLRYRIGLNNLILVDISSVEDPILSVVSHSLMGIHYMPIIFIFKRRKNIPPTMQEIHTFFEWCWGENMLNVALTYQVIEAKWNNITDTTILNIKNEVFNYTPFPVMTILNVTDQVYMNDYDFIENNIKDVYGYRFSTPMFMDPPNVFLTHYGVHGNRKISYFVTGTAGRTFHEYVHFVNGSIKVRPTHQIGYYHFQKKTLTYASKRLIDIGIHPYSSLLPYANLTEGSYPIAMTNGCVIVPFIHEIAHEEYIYRIMPTIIWLLWLMEMLSLFMIQCIHLGRLDIGSGIIYCFRTLMSQSMNIIEFKKRRGLLRSLHLFVILLSVLVNSSFSASFTSILSTTLHGKQIKSVEDLLQSGLKIMTTAHEKEVYFDNKLLPEALKPLLHIVNESVLQEHKDNLNVSYAYVCNSEEWYKYDYQQQLLRKPLLRISHTKDLCTVQQFLRFPVQWDSPFLKSLERFIIYSADSGLRQFWRNWSIYQASRMKLIQIWKPEVNDEEEKLFTINHFLTIINCYSLLMLLAILCFIGELVWFNCKKILKKWKGE